MKRISLFILITSLICFPVLVSARGTTDVSAASGIRVLTVQEKQIPSLEVESVLRGKEVTIAARGFPANETIAVSMKSRLDPGAGEYRAAVVQSSPSGSLLEAVAIPRELEQESEITIRLDSASPGSFASGWFYNTADLAVNAPAGGGTENTYTGYPTFMIEAVTKNQDVTIEGTNFPPDDSFVVRMHYYGTAGIGGTIVDTIDTGEGGSITETFTIPAAYHGLWKIAIRMDSPTSGYYAYNWFYNNTTGEGGGGSTSSYTGYPYFYIDAVTRDEAVTIDGYNFPPNDTFNVRMKYYGTYGIGGVIVETIETDEGGALSATFKIPSQLAGEYRIAIRLESSSSGYYAYNWFYNNTTIPPAELP